MNSILITGGAGFIGSALARQAIKSGYKVYNLDALTYSGRRENNISVASHPNYTFIKEDIRNADKIAEVICKYEPDFICHLAAESHVDRSIADARAFIDTNILGTFNLLEASLNYWIKKKRPKDFRFLQVSTDEVFGSVNETSGFTEASKYNPSNPYSASKAAADHLADAWFKTHGLPVIITNTSNNFGPFQFPEKLIPVTIIAAITGNRIPIYGDGKQIRDWIFVNDHANALLKVLTNGKIGSRYNIGANNEMKNIDVVFGICSILDDIAPKNESYVDQVLFVKDRQGHDQRYAIDATKIENELGWKPTIHFDSALKDTVEWYIQNKRWWKPMMAKAQTNKLK